MAAVTLFSFGYHGWGNATDRLVEIVDAVERSRGYAPPWFVDTRIRRSVRAVGFNGPAFERLLGPDRHRWMPELGNRHILTREGPAIQIAAPAAAEDLLDLALADRGRRLLFFCGCKWPRQDGQIACHRAVITELLLEAARRRGVAIEVVEWPGGDPVVYSLEKTTDRAKAVRDRVTFPLGPTVDLPTVGALPWGSCLRVGGLGALKRLTGPAAWRPHGWALPLFADDPADDWRTRSTYIRLQFGLQSRRT